MKPQIDDSHRAIVASILGPRIGEVFVFGSRAKGTAKPLSDLDLLLKADLNRDELAALKDHFEESNLPFKVDLVLEKDLDSTFLDRVEKDLIRF